MRLLVASFVVMLLAGMVAGQSKGLRFSDYRTAVVKLKKNASISLERDDMLFRTRLRWAAKNIRPNFAGHYIFTQWGCGASCVNGAVIDALTGKVYWWGFTVCCWDFDVNNDVFRPIDFRIDSKLMVFAGRRNEDEKDDQYDRHYYKFNNNRFTYLRTVKTKPINGK